MYPNFRARENYLIQNFLKLLYIITKNDKIEIYNIFYKILSFIADKKFKYYK